MLISNIFYLIKFNFLLFYFYFILFYEILLFFTESVSTKLLFIPICIHKHLKCSRTYLHAPYMYMFVCTRKLVHNLGG